MGLDIYVVKVNHQECDDREDENEPWSVWEEWRKTAYLEEPSKLYPDHLFKVGYFRSSYNSGGINQVVQTLGLPTLYDLFEGSDLNEYVLKPDWNDVRAECDKALAAYDALGDRTKFSVMTVSAANAFDTSGDSVLESEQKALDVFMEERSKAAKGDSGLGGWWSNNVGIFALDKPIQVHALLHGKDIFGAPAIFAVYTGDEDDEKGWYRQAYEIVRETAEYVLAHPSNPHWHLHWSG